MSVDLAVPAPAAGAGTAPGPEELRRVLRRHAAGVTVITLPGPGGFTASSFTSVSLAPPLVSFCLGRGASTARRLLAAEYFAVHLLGAEHAELARRFARSGVDRFAGLRWAPNAEGVPLLAAAGCRLEARVLVRHEAGDHLLTIGQVIRAGGPPPTTALLHHDGALAVAAPF
jgi:flavin reductase (DIM6/NTAB) family NADH-FMN oxidoreductase RutF